MTRLTDTLEVPAGTIAVGVDGSSGSDAALRAAVATAVGEHRSLTIVHAVGSAPESPLVLTDARAAAERQAPGLAVHLVLRVADPRDVLVGVSEDAAMVVVGSRGRGPTRSLLLGSVSLAVTRRASCPVVVVRPHHPGLVRHGILVAADGSPGSSPTLDFAFRQASVRRQPLTVLHVVEHAPDAVAEHELLVAEALAGQRERHPDVRVTTQLAHGRPDDAVLAAADRMDLLVVGAHHGGHAHRSITAAVVERARCPVAVVPLDTVASPG